TLRLLLLRRTTLSTLQILAPAETKTTPPAVEADAVAQATIVVDGLAVVAVVEADDHPIISKGHGINHGPIL
ncbi:hypothetical protein A2U01_0107829, partial [Trifolium medium]|nr:hypothetical protein [Trifolium medium]